MLQSNHLQNVCFPQQHLAAATDNVDSSVRGSVRRLRRLRRLPSSLMRLMRLPHLSNLLDGLFLGGRRRRVRLSSLVLALLILSALLLTINLVRR